MIGRPRKVSVGLIVFVMMFSSVVPIAIAEDDSGLPIANPLGDDTSVQPLENEELYDSDELTDVPNVSESLLGKLNTKFKIPIIIATQDVSELSAALQGVDYDGIIGTTDSSLNGISLPLLNVPGNAIEKLASLPSTIFIEEFETPVRDSAPSYEPLQSRGIIANNLNSTLNHKANLAWSKGYTGSDVEIAVIDDGIDFAHPDLMDKMARVDSLFLEENETIVDSATSGQTFAALHNFDIVPSSYILYLNGNPMSGASYALNMGNGTVQFTPPLNPGDVVKATYKFYSPYYGWPVAFDPASLRTLIDTRYPTDTWYANTTSDDRNVTHTIKIDGRFDFWDDGSELVATDSNADIITRPGMPAHEGNDYNLVSMYVTQDAEYWYFGLDSFANQTTMKFGLYINTTNSAPWTDGGDYDPVNRNPVSNQTLIDAIPEHRPEFVVYIDHQGGEERANWSKNDTIEDAWVYVWDQASGFWNGYDIKGKDIGGDIGYGGWDYEDLRGVIEFSIPKAVLGNPTNISVEMFTTGFNISHVQDTVYSDPNIPTFINPDWDLNLTTTLSAFTIVGKDFINQQGFWQHTYTRVDDTVAGIPNTHMTWPLKYIATGTSKSGVYWYGDHPDENYPLTRVLVVDEEVAGVYDTVYMDLDHNRDFRNDKPNKRYGKYDSQMKWNPPDWTGSGTIYTDVAYADFYDPAKGVTAVDWSPDGTQIATGSDDHTVVIWDLGPPIAYSKQLHAHYGRVKALDWSPNGTWLAVAYDDLSGNEDFNVAIWDVANGIIVYALEGHTAGLTDVDWSPTGTRLISSSLDSTVKIWDAVSGTLIGNFTDHTGPVYDVHWASDGRIASASEDKTVKMWDSNTSIVSDEYADYNPLTAVSINPVRNYIAYGSSTGWITIVDLNLALNVTDLPHNEFHWIWELEWSLDGNYLLSTASSDPTSTNDPSIAVWHWYGPDRWDYGPFAITGPHNGESVRGGSWSTNSTYLVTGGDDQYAQLWKTVGAPIMTRVDPSGQPFRGHEEGSLDYLRWNTGDGLPDVSGGMIYYIAQHRYNDVLNELQEITIPYSEVFVNRLGGDIKNYIAENGTLIAIMGNLDSDMDHGTSVASAIAARGRTDYFDATRMDVPTEGHVLGFAPDAKLVAIANIYFSNYYDGWYFAVEGYDGVRDTGDEPQIASNSFGFSNIDYAGFDFKSRFLDWLVNEYANKKVTFTFSAGNNGYGYGTVSTPASSPGVITVGSSTDFFYRHLSGLEDGDHPSYGDVAYESSRGPTMQGEPDPDILANGRMAFGDVGLNLVNYRPYDGSQATELWAGTSLASPGVAGMLALAFQAYKETNGDFPDSDTAKSIVMSSGDDINYDIFSQGAGLLNADRLTDIASDTDGVQVQPNQWVPGNYQGIRYPSFTKLMHPDQKVDNKETFTVSNHNPVSPKDVEVYDAVYHKTDEVNYSFVTVAEDRGEFQMILGASRFAVRDIMQPGVYDPGVYDMNEVKLVDINLTNWLNCDLMRITMYMNWTTLDENGDGNPEFSYFLDLYDWTFKPGSTTNVPHTGDYSDLNRMLIVYPDANVFEGRVHNPAQRTHDALVIGTRPGIQPGRLGAVGETIYVSLEFFEKNDWNWLTTDKNSTTLQPVGAGDTDTFEATIDVPIGTSVGTYQGGIYLQTEGGYENETTVVDNNFGPRFFRTERYHLKTASVYLNGAMQTEGVDYTLYADNGVVEFFNPLNNFDTVIVNYTYYEVSTIPVVVNVPSDDIAFEFGGIEPGQDDLYSNRVNGGFGNGAKSGEWRFYFIDAANQGLFKSGLGSKFLVNAKWDMPRTDIDVLAYGPGGGRSPLDPKEVLSPAKYGPYELFRPNGGSEQTANFFTTTGVNEEVVAPVISGGLNVIALHQVRLNGTMHLESVSGKVASLSVVPEEIKIVTNQLVGQRELQIHSTIPWDGIGSQSAGPSPATREINVHIKQDNIEGDSFIKMLAEGDYTKIVNVQKTALIFAVNITSLKEWTEKPSPDLDLGVFLDGMGPDNIPDGEATEDEFIAYGADSDAEEQVRLIKPSVFDDPDTPFINEEDVGVPYIIKVLGFTVPGNDATFNIDVTLVQGAGFEVEGLRPEGEIWGPLEISEITLKWDLPGNTTDGELLGALYLGPANSPFTVLIAIELVVDRVKPEVTEFALRTIGKELDIETNRTTNHKKPDISCTLRDAERGELDWRSIRVFFDETNVTSEADINVAFTDTAGKYGYYEGTVTYTPPTELKEGAHRFEVYASDIAGNENYGKMDFMVDSTAPNLILEGDLVEATSDPVASVSGWTEPDKTVIIREKTVIADGNGYFEVDLDLVEGENVIDVVAVDFFGVTVGKEVVRSNAKSIQKVIIYDVKAPTLSELRFDEGALTSSEFATLTGRVEDLIANDTLYDPTTVAVTVNEKPVYIEGDGTFSILLPLLEGTNVHIIEAMDMAGNTATDYRNITLDTVAPGLVIEELPGTTEESTITIYGTAEPGVIVTVNGKFVSVASDGSFEEDVTLAEGANLIVIETTDSAGNSRASRVVVEMAVPDLTPWMFVIMGAVVALMVGLVVGSVLKPKEEVEIEDMFEEGIPEEVTEEEEERLQEEEAMEEEPPAPEEEDPKVAMLKKAYSEGKLSKELYELNLKKLQEK
jgi:WD40 repeat protein/sulfur carrier protein ThiS